MSNYCARLVTSVAIVLLCGLLSVVVTSPAQALQFQNRSLALGTSAAGATTSHTFSFTFADTSPVGSIEFEYCDSPLQQLPCTAPSGLDVSQVTLQQQSGETGFTVLSRTANQIILTRAPASAPTGASASYEFDGAVNPGGAPGTFYGRISSFGSSDGSGTLIDYGAVVNATTVGVSISTEVPPILSFCVAQAIPGDCASASGNEVDLGTLVSSQAAVGTSQMLGGTNAAFGFAITVNGVTMTSGNNAIPALATPTPSAPGNAQFGINLRANNDPVVGQDPIGPGVANPTGGYNQVNRFKFIPGDVIATTTSTTDSRKFTVSYVVNTTPIQPPGVYSTTLTYVCTATF